MLDDVWGAMGDLEGCKVTQVDVPRLDLPGLEDSAPGGVVDCEWYVSVVVGHLHLFQGPIN